MTATKVITFRPAAPTGPHQRGNCWTDSIAVDRPGAWRCMVVNSIYDPCFTNPKLKTAVVCDAEPVTNKPGFVLELTKPLPEPRSKRLPDKLPWLLKLADGSTCEVSTGTTAFVNGVTIPYGCSDSQKCNDDGCPYMTGVTEHLKRGKVWIVDKVAFRSTKTGMELLKRETMPVVAVWQ
ncbi:MAG TPA: hypothetical protein VMB26_11860 [Candidatus Binataceae bacterium]|nr:hypothetical protein [Candidatus Binataceae bacterium]